MVANFRTYEGQSRLLTAVIAAHPELKLNYKEIAKHFGSDWTTSGVEHFFRPIKKNSIAVRNIVSSGGDAKDFAHPMGKEPATLSAATLKTPSKGTGSRKRAAPSSGKSTGGKKMKFADAKKIDLNADLDDDSSENERPPIDTTPSKPSINQQKLSEHLQRVGFVVDPPPALEPAQTAASPEDDDYDAKPKTPIDTRPCFSFNAPNSSASWGLSDRSKVSPGKYFQSSNHEDDEDDGAC